MRRALWLLILSGACKDPDDGDDADGDDDDGTTDVVGDTADSGTPEDTDTTLRDGCYADYALDLSDDGVLETTGIDVYDVEHTDLLLRSERDFGGGLEQTATDYDYDSEWRLVRYAYDDGNDGSDDYVVVYTYDTYDNVVTWEYDSDGDGAVDEISMATWTPDGDVLTYSRDDDADGDPDYGYAYTYVDGVRVAATEDQDGDEVTDHWYTYTYDEVDRLVRAETDEGNDGTVDRLWERTYTDPLLLVGSTSIDEGNDGTLDYTSTFAYDALERLLSLTEDEGADGFVDHEFSASYDLVTGFLSVEDEEWFTPPPDDDWVDWSHDEYTYDAQARLVEQVSDGEYADDDFEYGRTARQTWTFGGSCP